jgi:PAS domain S-box-containing protein
MGPWAELVVRATGYAVIAADQSGRVTVWNAAAERIFGYTAEEMLGRPVARIVPESLREAHERCYVRAMMNPPAAPTDEFTLPAVHRDGTELNLQGRLCGLAGEDGRIVGACLLVRAVGPAAR